jgi:hypothetical protein
MRSDRRGDHCPFLAGEPRGARWLTKRARFVAEPVTPT